MTEAVRDINDSDGAFCMCCMLALVNDEPCTCTGPEAHPDGGPLAALAQWEQPDRSVATVLDGAELEFSHMQCDGCGTFLAGNRYGVVFITND